MPGHLRQISRRAQQDPGSPVGGEGVFQPFVRLETNASGLELGSAWRW